MITVIRIQSLLKLSILVGTLLAVRAEHASAAPVVIPEQREDWEVPSVMMTMAYDTFNGRWAAPDRLGSQYQLMRFALWETEGTVARNRAYALAQGWRRGFVEALDDALLFARKIRTSDGDDVLAVSHAFREIGSKEATLLAELLLTIASTGSTAAELEMGQRMLGSPLHAAARDHARRMIRRLADGGYAAALADIVGRYRTGNGFDRDL